MKSDQSHSTYDNLLCSAARRLKGVERRLFQAEVTQKLCSDNARQAERRFGWGRQTIRLGQHETKSKIGGVDNTANRGPKNWEAENPQFLADVRAIVEPHTQADPELKSQRIYTNLSAREVILKLKLEKSYPKELLPSERTMRRVLNRLNYRRKRIQKGKPKKNGGNGGDL